MSPNKVILKTRKTLIVNIPAITEPKMFPIDVWEFQMPKMRPFLLLPNQLATAVTTPGHPVAWTAPAKA